MEAFDEVPITGLVLKNVNITGAEKEIRALNWQNSVLENVVINGKTYPRPVETKIIGVPIPGSTVEGSSVLLGGNSSNLSYEWQLADSPEGTWSSAGSGKNWTVPADAAGKYVKLTATDANGSQESSIPYKVLKSNVVSGLTGHEVLMRAATKGYIDEDEVLDLSREITNRDCARILARLWNLEAPKERIQIIDVPESDPDYNVIAAVVEAGMMNLKDPSIAAAQGTLYNAGVSKDAASKRTAFLPEATIDRDEMGYIAILSCGVPYNETLGTKPKFDDASEIESVYSANVGASVYFGFMGAKEGNLFKPKDHTTMGELIGITTQMSDFAHK